MQPTGGVAEVGTSGAAERLGAAADRDPRGMNSGPALDDSVVEELLASVNRRLLTADKRLQFLIHEGTGRVQLRVLERSTDEVIRELPPDRMLDLVEKMHELIGLLIDETA